MAGPTSAIALGPKIRAGSLDTFLKRDESSSISDTNLIEICVSNSTSQIENNNVEENDNEPQLENTNAQNDNLDVVSGSNSANIEDILSDYNLDISYNPQIESSALSAKFKYDIVDPSTWPVEIDNKQRMVLVKQSSKSIKVSNIKEIRKEDVSVILFYRQMKNGEKELRKLLFYSYSIGNIFCFCSLFSPIKIGLTSSGFSDYAHTGIP